VPDQDTSHRTLGGGDIPLATLVLSLAPFLAVLDLTLVNIILPHIAGMYGATPKEATLVVTFFAVAQAISMPLSGALAQRFGVVRMFLLSLVGFALASLLCGMAPTLGALVLFRILQGFAAGPIIPLSQAIMQRTLPGRFVPMALTIFGVAMMSGPLVGPALGGLLADTVGWRWGFFVNVPIAAACILMSARMFTSHESRIEKQPIDGVGLALMVVWVTSLQVVLDQGHDLEWFASPLILLLSAAAAVGFIAFLIWELTDQHPIVDLSVFRYRSFRVASVVTAITYAAATASSLVVYLWLQTGLHYDATTAGLVSAITGTPGLLVAPLAAWLATRIDLRILAGFGLALSGVAMIMRTQFVQEIDFFHVMLPQIVIGVSGAFFWGPLIAIGMQDVPREKISSAAGLLTFTRTLVFAMQVALLLTFWDRGAQIEHEGLAAAMTDTAPALNGLQALGLAPEQAMTLLNGMADSQSVILSLQHLFWFLSAVFLAGIVAIWVAPPRSAVARNV
jgi:DHA2 family multidrug resistance protein